MNGSAAHHKPEASVGERKSGTVMAGEMLEQPAVLARLVDRFGDYVQRVSSVVPRPLAGVVFAARGSSDNAAVFGRYLAELAAGRPAGLAAPSLHTLYRAQIDCSGYLAIALSQSGATPEIVTVCERMRIGGARTVGIVNDADSPLAQAVEVVLPIGAQPERAVPATKTVTGQLLATGAVAAALGPVPFGRPQLEALPGAVAAVLADQSPATALARLWMDAERVFIIARGLLYAAALEAALKIKETTAILAEGISAADFRHGPIAAVDPDVPVLVLDGLAGAASDVSDLVRLLRRQGATVAVCATRPEAELPLPDGTSEALAVITATVRAQQLALALATTRGRDPDTPSGLSKVTATR
jgi:glucosamine--fructose-6-phosphate aminotransferase (isomerizing)